MKSKIRVKRAEDGNYYVVKTSKLISKEEAEEVRARQIKAKAHSKKKR
jgi:hypothetical protein